MADFYAIYPPGSSSSGGGVSSLNTLTGALILAAGSGITITPSGDTLTIAASGGGGGLNTTMSNMTDPVALNKSLLAGSGSINLGDDQGAAFRDLFVINALNDDAGVKAFDVANRALCDFNGATVLVFDDSGEILIAPTNGLITTIGVIKPNQDIVYNQGDLTQRYVTTYTTGIDSGASPLSISNLGVTWVWPATDGSSGQGIVTDAAGNLSFGNPLSGAAGSDGGVQFAASGVLAADANLLWDNADKVLNVKKVSLNDLASTGYLTVGNAIADPSTALISIRVKDAAAYGFDVMQDTAVTGDLYITTVNNDVPTEAFRIQRSTQNIVCAADISAATLTPANGATGTFTTVDLKTVTVTNGIITSIV